MGKRKKTNKKKFFRDAAIFAAAVALTVFIASSEAFHNLIVQLAPIALLAELVAGALYTSFLTIPISLSVLSVLASEGNLLFIAVVGGIGATIGDFVIMSMIQRAGSSLHIKSAKWSRFKKNRTSKILLAVLGVICLALPVPDEVAMGILGITHLKLKTFILLVYPAKTAGILAVLLSLQAIQ